MPQDNPNQQPPPPPPPPESSGRISGLLNAVKGLTLTNVAVIILLMFIAGPAYIVYRALNDDRLLDRILSDYREIHSESNCLIREVKQRGGPNNYAIATGFAYQGSDRWQISVVIDHEPDGDDIQSYCNTLNLLVDFMRDPDARSPVFPGTDTPVVQMYPKTPPEGFGGPR